MTRLLILLLLSIAGCAPNVDMGAPDAVTNAFAGDASAMSRRDSDDAPAELFDDRPRDAAHPARNRQLLVPSHGEGMNGLFLLAAGEGPHQTAILLHGLPGNERNMDLAQALRRAGWNVLTFTYRGAWGSPGRFSISNALEDAAAALAFLRTDEAAREYGIDRDRLALVGHSMGGFAAALVAANDRPPSGVEPLYRLVLIDAWNVGATARQVRAGGAQGRAAFIASLDDLGHALNGSTAESLADEVIAHGPGWDLMDRVPALARIETGIFWASEGLAADNRALFEALSSRPEQRVAGGELETDHGFADSRLDLTRRVVLFLWPRALF